MAFSTDGRWTGVQQTPGDSHTTGDGLGVFVIHATLMRTGEILWFSGHTEDAHYLTESYVWDPTQPVSSAVRQPFPSGVDLFCGHHANLEDGRVITVGGAMSSPHGRGIRDVCVFDPIARAWTKIGDMQHGRWYPTLVTLPDGRLVVFSGRTEDGGPGLINSTVELLSPPFTGPGYTPTVLAGADKTFPTYPGLHLVHGGRIVHTGPTWRYEDTVTTPIRTFSFRLTGETSGAWTDDGVGPSVPQREEGMSVLLPPAQDGRILLVGGADANFNSAGSFTGLASGVQPHAAEILDTTTTPPTWTRIGDTTHPRINVNAVLLPDGKVLILGGHNNFKFDASSTPSNQSEIYDPVLNTWTPAATMGAPRMYHSAALLLPDGRVVVAGGFDPNGPGDGNRKSFEIYEPPYFFNPDDTLATRPTITSISAIDGPGTQLAYGGRFIINTPDAANIRKVALMRPGSVTHHTDSEQRYIALDFIPGPGPNQLTAQIPGDPSIAPPGYYMVWIVDLNNRPCARAPFAQLLRSRCFVIIDRSHYSKDEVNATPPPATDFNDAFYVVMDGFLPSELGINSGTATSPPPGPLSPAITFRRGDGSVVNELSATPLQLLYELPALPAGVRQRFTFKYRLTINGTAPFFQADGTTAIEMQNITLEASLNSYVGRGTIRLHHQPNPYMFDGETTWLSIDLQVFKIRAGETRFGQPAHGTTDADASAFIQGALNHFDANPGDFNGLVAAASTTELDWSYTRGGQRVFNYAIAKVRFRGIALPATNVRVFFRLFTVAATGTEFRANTTYKTLANVAGDPIPVLGLVGSDIGTMPFFASPRVNTSFQRLTDQTDIPNRKTLAATGGGESTTFFGCWLDFNNTAARYPWHPANDVGPFASGLQSIQTLINGRHQCLVAEIHFSPNPANPLVVEGDSPGASDKLAQRNLAIVYTTNPGTDPTRTVQHTFELRPPRHHGFAPPATLAAVGIEGHLETVGRRQQLISTGPDELMILWNTLPRDTEAE
ncbi:MAG TPA: galactose oxidase-like domain-containing protein, partial [Blastocatellia bacterium]|nr:galactose oxidase-like domain-containing protein [Blastocatellia bacterium]